MTGFEIVGVYVLVFLGGMLIYLADYRPNQRAALISAAAFVALGVGLWLWPATRGLVAGGGWPEAPARSYAMIWALTLLPFVAWNVRQPSALFDRKIGDFSYSLYLTHYPVIQAMNDMRPGGMLPMDKILTLAIILSVATVFYFLVDAPLERWRKALFSS